ncbi:hypothetical protein KL86CLO1_10748 [uncultured Eubacteriales bacterium]|uniref:Uncharacterized protein n=1 Tax=uncultured Eubacteriales bacterium TaxID=172733 RepID=A0A212J9U1_9FIRM|nr:hypothetical protein KL86CLO1_10748 [uncultured Eubacteriales bacterium]
MPLRLKCYTRKAFEMEKSSGNISRYELQNQWRYKNEYEEAFPCRTVPYPVRWPAGRLRRR